MGWVAENAVVGSQTFIKVTHGPAHVLSKQTGFCGNVFAEMTLWSVGRYKKRGCRAEVGIINSCDGEKGCRLV